jgi:4-hydroxyphenylpyruvate dioxygenase
LKFLSIDDGYYDLLKQRLAEAGPQVVIDEDLEQLKEQKILVDFDEEGGYLLQIFAETMEDRPTLFIEIIQKKHDHRGFGAGNFKQLFELLELQQVRRGTEMMSE